MSYRVYRSNVTYFVLLVISPRREEAVEEFLSAWLRVVGEVVEGHLDHRQDELLHLVDAAVEVLCRYFVFHRYLLLWALAIYELVDLVTLQVFHWDKRGPLVFEFGREQIELHLAVHSEVLGEGPGSAGSLVSAEGWVVVAKISLNGGHCRLEELCALVYAIIYSNFEGGGHWVTDQPN